MFTGLDLIVVLAVILGIFYLARPPQETSLDLDPLTLLVVLIVLIMIVVSLG